MIGRIGHWDYFPGIYFGSQTLGFSKDLKSKIRPVDRTMKQFAGKIGKGSEPLASFPNPLIMRHTEGWESRFEFTWTCLAWCPNLRPYFMLTPFPCDECNEGGDSGGFRGKREIVFSYPCTRLLLCNRSSQTCACSVTFTRGREVAKRGKRMWCHCRQFHPCHSIPTLFLTSSSPTPTPTTALPAPVSVVGTRNGCKVLPTFAAVDGHWWSTPRTVISRFVTIKVSSTVATHSASSPILYRWVPGFPHHQDLDKCWRGREPFHT